MKKIFSLIIAVAAVIVTLSVNASAFSSNSLISLETAGSNNGNAKLTEIANQITNDPTGEGDAVDGLPEVEDHVVEEKVELSPDEVFQDDFPIEEEQEEPLIDNKVSIPEGVLGEGNEFTEVENPKTGSSSTLPAIIAAGTIGISLFLLGKKK